MGKPAPTESLDSFLDNLEAPPPEAAGAPDKPNRYVPLRKFNISGDELGKADTIRNNILTLVLGEQYDRASKEIKEYVNSKESLPQFRGRTSRYADYCADLIAAIRIKRSFPGMAQLSMGKQEELQNRAIHHFEELKRMLIQIEAVERELKLDDVRSTVWVVQSIVYGILIILVYLFVHDVSKGTWKSGEIVMDDYVSQASEFLVKKLHL